MAMTRGNLTLVVNDGEPPDNDLMEARVAKLEDFAEKTGARLAGIDVRLAKIETRLDTFATKEDLQREMHSLSWRVIGAMLTFGTMLTGIVYYIARNVH